MADRGEMGKTWSVGALERGAEEGGLVDGWISEGEGEDEEDVKWTVSPLTPLRGEGEEAATPAEGLFSAPHSDALECISLCEGDESVGVIVDGSEAGGLSEDEGAWCG